GPDIVPEPDTQPDAPSVPKPADPIPRNSGLIDPRRLSPGPAEGPSEPPGQPSPPAQPPPPRPDQAPPRAGPEQPMAPPPSPPHPPTPQPTTPPTWGAVVRTPSDAAKNFADLVMAEVAVGVRARVPFTMWRHKIARW